MTLPDRIVLASGNAGKLRELTALFGSWPVRVLAQTELGVTAAEETGATFAENALIKARHAAAVTGLPAIADDSGIEVDVLGGAPGVRSARYAGPGASDEANRRLLLAHVAETGVARPAARFRCALAYVDGAEDSAPVVTSGVWEGFLVPAPRGRGGFGYDPVFFVPTHGCTSAELDPAEKNRISHRARALSALRRELGARFALPPRPLR